MFFPSSQYRQRFYDLIIKLTEGEEGMMTNLDEESIGDQVNVFFFLLIFMYITKTCIHFINLIFF